MVSKEGEGAPEAGIAATAAAAGDDEACIKKSNHVLHAALLAHNAIAKRSDSDDDASAALAAVTQFFRRCNVCHYCKGEAEQGACKSRCYFYTLSQKPGRVFYDLVGAFYVGLLAMLFVLVFTVNTCAPNPHLPGAWTSFTPVGDYRRGACAVGKTCVVSDVRFCKEINGSFAGPGSECVWGPKP
jgi:hypothetical protein